MDKSFNLYVESNLSEKKLLIIINKKFGGSLKNNWLNLEHISIDVCKNDVISEYNKKKFSTGFLDFRYRFIIESLSINNQYYKDVISNLLKFLWSINIPAVAACDFEDELPEKGGVSGNCPWPGKDIKYIAKNEDKTK